MGFPGFNYVDPDHVFDLVISRRAHDLFLYLDSIPGAFQDLQCHKISFAGMALQAPRPSGLQQQLPDEVSWALYWAEYARIQAAKSRLCAPRINDNQFKFASKPVFRGDAMLYQLFPSSSNIPVATFAPPQANYNDAISFPLTCAGTLNHTSAFSSGLLNQSHASAFVPLKANFCLARAFAELSLGPPGSEKMMQNTISSPELEQNNHSLRQPGSELYTPQKLMPNGEVPPTVDIKGKRPALEEQEEKILRLNVASSCAQDCSKGTAGVLIRKKDTGQFICASCFPVPGTEPGLFLAAACCEGIKIAQAYQPNTIVLESHMLHLLNPLWTAQTPRPEIEELVALLELKTVHCWSVTLESNGAARELAIRCLQTGVPEIFFSVPPNWLNFA